jgi:hypothetical protein
MERYRWVFLTLAVLLLSVCSSTPGTTTLDDNKTDIENIEPQYRSIEYMSRNELKAELEKIKNKIHH